MTLLFIDIKYFAGFFGKLRIDFHKSGGNIFMCSTFTYVKCFSSLSYSSLMFNYVICQLYGTFFYIVSHVGTPQDSFIQSMPEQDILC